MKKIIFIVHVMLFYSWLLPAKDTSDFSSLFEAALQNKLNISEEHIERGQQFAWVFVTGFFNEGARWPFSWISRYFGDHRDRLKTYVPGEEIYVLRPSSVNSIETNAGLLLKELRVIYERHHKKMVVITHSKGSAEILKMIANEPQETGRMVQAVFTIQGAFGTQLADLLMGDKGERRFLGLFPLGSEGLKSLTTYEADRIFSPDVIQILAAQNVPIYFLRTSQKIGGKRNSVAFGILGSAKYLSFYGENDGLITSERQKLQGVGIDLGILNADHTDTVLDPPSSNTPSSFRYALMDAFFFYLMSR